MRRAVGITALLGLLTAGVVVATAAAPIGTPTAPVIPAVPPAAGTGEAVPQRVVSLNLCTDQLAVLLLPAERIAALSFLSRDPTLSHVAERAAALPVVRGQAEEVLALKPDLVLAGTFTTRPTVALLRARGVPVVELGLAADFDDIRAQTRQIAAALGVPERGEALLQAMEAMLAEAAAPADGARPTALTLAPGGFTAGAGTLSDAVMGAAGLINHAATHGLSGYGYLPVETVATTPPDLLLADLDPRGHPSLAGRLLAHPALARSVPAEARLRIPGALLTCGGPWTAEAVRLLAQARAGVVARTSPRLAEAAGPGDRP